MPDRPLECSECKKPIAFHYVEIVGKNRTDVGHCADCPILRKKLLAETTLFHTESSKETISGLCCGTCGTTLEAIRMGNPLGCPECYEVFSDALFVELIGANKIPEKMREQPKSAPLHIGRTPGEAVAFSPSARLLALNEALTETLNREDYEQAALLRDQIKELTEQNGEKGTKQTQGGQTGPSLDKQSQ